MALPTVHMITNKQDNFIELFSEPFVNRFPDVKAFEMLQKLNAIFVIVPEADLCLKACQTTAGRPPYIVKFKSFSEKSQRAVDTFVSKNPLFSPVPEISGQNLLQSTKSYSVPNELTYSQFVDLVEAHCTLLAKQKEISVKRFSMNMDFISTGKMQFTALPSDQTFLDLLDKYRGEADLYDDSFTNYAWDLMIQNKVFTETTDDNCDDAT